MRCRWSDKGIRLPDECPSCAPQSFEKFTTPFDKKIWMGYEAHPNEYERRDGGFDRKPEYRAEQEAKLHEATAEEIAVQREAEARKRATRRTQPMTFSEMQQAVRVAEHYARALQESNDA